MGNVILLDDESWAELVRVMENPAPPTEGAIAANRMHRKLLADMRAGRPINTAPEQS